MMKNQCIKAVNGVTVCTECGDFPYFCLGVNSVIRRTGLPNVKVAVTKVKSRTHAILSLYGIASV
jgi:hypothetical protein